MGAPASGGTPGLGLAPAALAAGVAGLGCMAAELSAVRLLAPHFGDSAYVWTNVIGVILAALAVGAWLGGRLARSVHVRGRAASLLLAAGVGIALSPWVASALGSWLAPGDLPLDAAMPALVRGSFVATALLFGPAMLALGTVSPLLVTAAVRGGRDVGQAAGAVGAAGTLGSLVGTFAATHWLVPTFGCRVAMGLAGALLVAAAGLVAVARARTASAAVLLLALAALWPERGPLRPAAPGRELLAESESRVQFLQVVRDGRSEPASTALVINEGLDSFHSLAVAGSAFTGGRYYDWHALAPLLLADEVRAPDLRALSIGDAAGTLRAIYAAVHPGARVDAVDIDAKAMELGDRFFPGPKAAGERAVLDGRVYLARATARWHVIHVDAYAHQVYVPAHLASREFFAAAYARLLDGGVIACNVGALHGDDPVLRAIGTTMASVFGHARAFLVPSSRNALLVARRGEAPQPHLLHERPAGGAGLSEADAAHWRHVVQVAASSPWHDVGQGGPVLVDDRPALDELLAQSYIARRDEGIRIRCAGAVEVAGAELAAYACGRRRDWPGVLRSVAESAGESASLRELAGDARWSLRELRSALAEYERALALTDDDAQRTRLAGKLRDVAADREPVAAAEAIAARNGWLQWGLVAAAVALAAVLRRPA